MQYRFTDLIDIRSIRQMMESFYSATGIPSTLVDPQGGILSTAGSQDICTQFHRIYPQTQERCRLCDQYFLYHLMDGPYAENQCLNGLMAYAAPIVLDGQPVASIFLGQFLHEPANKEVFLRQAREFGFDEAAYMEALQKVPIVPEERSEALLAFIVDLVQSQASKGLEHLRLMETTAELKRSEESSRLAYEELEARVRQRTLELSDANKALKKEITFHKRTLKALRRSNTELGKSEARMTLMLRSIRMAGVPMELDRVLEWVAKNLAKATGVTHCAIYLMNSENGRLERRADTKSLNHSQRLSVQDWKPDPAQIPLIQAALTRMEPMVSQDARSDSLAKLELISLLDIRSVLVVPVKVGHQALGVAIIYSLEEAHFFTRKEIDLASGIANSVALAVENAQLYDETRQRLAETQAVQRITSGLLQKARLQEILDIVCQEALKLTGATGSAVLLLEGSQWLQMANSAGTTLSIPEHIPLQGSLAELAIQKNGPVLVNDPASLGEEYFRYLQLTCLLVVPLRVDSSLIGAIDVVNKPEGFTQNDIRIISLFADQAAIVIEHTRLHERVEQDAVNEERGRLARELHDSVSQALFSANLYAEAARMALASEKQAVALENLEKLRSMTREAILEMRLLIFELHPVVLEKEGLIAALQARLAAVEGRAGLQTEIQVDGEERLPISVGQELYRIAQESLNNIVKHARAHGITLHLKFDAQSVCMEIHDDGIGFDPKAARQSGGLGLRGIKERVQRMGGKLEIKSSSKAGTTLRVTAPIKEI
ncbi:MAG: PocR ligand-binding domain-containing protein [Anaerolineales bacterium]